MESAHGENFVRVRPFGSLGDKGCDGYRKDTGAVYQCYAPQQPQSGTTADLCKKIGNDFAKAKEKLSDIMASWHFTHNYMTGLPVNAEQTLYELRRANPGIPVKTFGPLSIQEALFNLSETDIILLLGQVPSSNDYLSPDIPRLVEMLHRLTTNRVPTSPEVIKPVPQHKIDYNDLSVDTAALISAGMLNEPLVSDYIKNNADAMVGDTIAEALKSRYAVLREEAFEPDDVFSKLYSFVAGEQRIKDISSSEHVMTQAILSYFFNSCDIFEDKPQGQRDSAASH